MTDNDIIRMAREAGPLTQGPFDEWCKRFAALVAEQEREAGDKVVASMQVYVDRHHAVTLKMIERSAEKEREACAKLVDHILKDGGGTYGDAIRARGTP